MAIHQEASSRWRLTRSSQQCNAIVSGPCMPAITTRANDHCGQIRSEKSRATGNMLVFMVGSGDHDPIPGLSSKFVSRPDFVPTCITTPLQIRQTGPRNHNVIPILLIAGWTCQADGWSTDGVHGSVNTSEESTLCMHFPDMWISWLWCSSAAVVWKGDEFHVRTLAVCILKNAKTVWSTIAMPKVNNGRGVKVTLYTSGWIGMMTDELDIYERTRRVPMIIFQNVPFGWVQPAGRDPVIRRKLVLNWSWHSDISAAWSDLEWTNPVDSVDAVTSRLRHKLGSAATIALLGIGITKPLLSRPSFNATPMQTTPNIVEKTSPPMATL